MFVKVMLSTPVSSGWACWAPLTRGMHVDPGDVASPLWFPRLECLRLMGRTTSHGAFSTGMGGWGGPRTQKWRESTLGAAADLPCKPLGSRGENVVIPAHGRKRPCCVRCPLASEGRELSPPAGVPSLGPRPARGHGEQTSLSIRVPPVPPGFRD